VHELSIALSLAELVEAQLHGQLHAEPCTSVSAVDIRIGALASVVPEALAFAWDAVAQGTRLEGAALRIERQEHSAALELVAIELADA
jgi:Zn finger protein HypA/HybF involved in hydrogenase expression